MAQGPPWRRCQGGYRWITLIREADDSFGSEVVLVSLVPVPSYFIEKVRVTFQVPLLNHCMRAGQMSWNPGDSAVIEVLHLRPFLPVIMFRGQ